MPARQIDQPIGAVAHGGDDDDDCVPSRRASSMRSATRRISSSEPTEVPPYFWTMSGIRRGLDSRTRSFAHPGLDARERGVERGGIRAAGLGHVGPAAAAPPTCCATLPISSPALILLGLVLRHAGDQQYLVRPFDRREHDDGGLQLVLQLIHGVAQRPRIGAVDARGQHLHAVDFARGTARDRRPARSRACP